VVTERTRIAMPETGIGFVPDVGGTWLLAHASGQLGTHAALTGAQLGAGDAIAMGLADWFVPTDHLAGLLSALGDVRATGPDLSEQLGGLLDQMGEPAPEPGLGSSRWWIDRCYAGTTAEAIVASLSASGVQDAEDTAKTIGERSPSCVKVALESLRRARRAGSLEQVLDTEFRVSLRCLAAPDMVEGIRAQVVDKDRTPRWDPAVLERVDDDLVASYFAPLDGIPELGLEDAR
jgi:enoyl-CoA hydratase